MRHLIYRGAIYKLAGIGHAALDKMLLEWETEYKFWLKTRARFSQVDEMIVGHIPIERTGDDCLYWFNAIKEFYPEKLNELPSIDICTKDQDERIKIERAFGATVKKIVDYLNERTTMSMYGKFTSSNPYDYGTSPTTIYFKVKHHLEYVGKSTD